MDQQTLIQRLQAALEPDGRVKALFLSGSFGKGTADAWSDVDLLILADPADHEPLAADWRGILEAISPIPLLFRLPHALVLSSVTEDWQRVDLEIAAPAGFSRAQDRLQPLIDRDGVYPTLPATTPPPTPNPGRLDWMVKEFIRILGLTPVALGRREYELMATGSGMLRRMLTDLLILETGREQGGMLHLSRVLDPEQMQLLQSIPVAQPNRDSAIAAHLALARHFIPRARTLLAAWGGEWPTAFESATRTHLNRHLPAPHRADW